MYFGPFTWKETDNRTIFDRAHFDFDSFGSPFHKTRDKFRHASRSRSFQVSDFRVFFLSSLKNKPENRTEKLLNLGQDLLITVSVQSKLRNELVLKRVRALYLHLVPVQDRKGGRGEGELLFGRGTHTHSLFRRRPRVFPSNNAAQLAALR